MTLYLLTWAFFLILFLYFWQLSYLISFGLKFSLQFFFFLTTSISTLFFSLATSTSTNFFLFTFTITFSFFFGHFYCNHLFFLAISVSTFFFSLASAHFFSLVFFLALALVLYCQKYKMALVYKIALNLSQY